MLSSEFERLLSSQFIASSHEQTIIDILPCVCLFPPTLDGSRFPRRDVGDTGEISEGWLASTELQT